MLDELGLSRTTPPLGTSAPTVESSMRTGAMCPKWKLERLNVYFDPDLGRIENTSILFFTNVLSSFLASCRKMLELHSLYVYEMPPKSRLSFFLQGPSQSMESSYIRLQHLHRQLKLKCLANFALKASHADEDIVTMRINCRKDHGKTDILGRGPK